MQRARTIYDVELTYKPNIEGLDSEEYKKRYLGATDDEKTEIINKYHRIAKKHIKALHQSVRGHAGTQRGKGWSGCLHSVISCHKGYCSQDLLDAVKEYPDLSKKIEYYFDGLSKQPDRLHIHLLVEGEPGRTIVEWICQYWQRNKKYGWVKKRKLKESDLAGWYNEYTASQCLGAITAQFGQK